MVLLQVLSEFRQETDIIHTADFQSSIPMRRTPAVIARSLRITNSEAVLIGQTIHPDPGYILGLTMVPVQQEYQGCVVRQVFRQMKQVFTLDLSMLK